MNPSRLSWLLLAVGCFGGGGSTGADTASTIDSAPVLDSGTPSVCVSTLPAGMERFGEEQTVYADPTQEVYDLAVADLDGDGDLDVAGASLGTIGVDYSTYGSDQFAVWWNEGADFSAPDTVAEVLGPRSVEAADVDGDGDLDLLVTAATGSDTVGWYPNTGAGFGPLEVLDDALLGAAHAIAADLDGDGDLDVAAAHATTGTVAWDENLGGGTFGAAV